MTIVARRIVATPVRSATATWAVIVDLLAPKTDSPARAELQNIAGIASSLVADEAFKDAAAIVYGSGPRVRVYCLYGDNAVTGENASEAKLASTPTDGDWKMSLPCSADDLAWVQGALKNRSSRVFARDMTVALAEDSEDAGASADVVVNTEAFLRS